MSEEKPEFRNHFERMIDEWEKRTGKPWLVQLAEDLPGAVARAAVYEKEGIKDVVTVPAEDFAILLETGKLTEKGRSLIGHPYLGATKVGGIVVVAVYGPQGERVETRARVVSLVRPYKKKNFLVDWQIELIK